MNNILIINTILSFIILFINLILKRSKGYTLNKFIISITLPIAGPLYCIVTWIFKYKDYSGENIKEYENYIREEMDIKHIKDVNKEKEINMIPLEDALILNTNSKKRELVIEMIKKENSINYIHALKNALEDSDTETSHYAASVITELRGEFNSKLKVFKEQFALGNKDEDFLKEYINCLNEYLNSGFLDVKSYHRYLKVFDELLEVLLKVNPSSKEDYYIFIIDSKLSLEDYDNAKFYCMKFFENHKDTENTFLSFMKLFYLTNDKKNFYIMLEALKKYPIKLSNEALNIVRFWSRGDKYE